MNDEEARGRTEALYREVNERIAQSAERFDADATEFVCECSDPSCTHRVEATLTEYERVREDATTFMLVPGHEQDDIERVRSHRGRYVVVEKVQEAVRATVRRLDPRADAV